MVNLSPSEIEAYHANGYLVLRGCLARDGLIPSILEQIAELGRTLIPSFELENAADLISRLSNFDRTRFYSALRYLSSLVRLGTSSELLALTNQLGIRVSAIMRSYNIRMDMPHESRFLFPWHQDIAYLLGSLNSLTFWVPMGRADQEHGSIEVIPGSHVSGLAPVRYAGKGSPAPDKSMSPKDLVLIEEPAERGTIIEAESGDLVVFSQFLMHRSVPNRSDLVRWTAQIRYSDLAEPVFASAGYPFGDRTNLFNNPYLTRAEKA